jgi:hypothetical protein
MYGEAQDAIVSGTPGEQGSRWSALEENRSIQGQRGVVGGGTIGRSNTLSREPRRRVNPMGETKAASPIVSRAFQHWSSQAVRVPVGALKRLTTVEQRGTVRLIEKGKYIGKQTRLNATSEQSRGA